MLKAVLPATIQAFDGALVMPNLSPPVTTQDRAKAYRAEILSALPPNHPFRLFLTCYLTDQTSPSDVVKGYQEDVWTAAKLYPAHATTNSADGVSNPLALMPVYRAMAEAGMPLCVHGEVTDPSIDVFDRETVFLDNVLRKIANDVPTLRFVVEHATTQGAVDFVREFADRAAASITPHHLWWSRNALFDGGLRPHAYCLPILKREQDRLALIEAATSGEPCFFAGTDSAPHTRQRKECDHGCAGVYCAPSAISAYAQVFDKAGALEKLPGFLSTNGPQFYGLAASTQFVTLERSDENLPSTCELPGGDSIEVFLGGEPAGWCLRS